VLVAAAVVGACGGGADAVDKAGGDTVVLELASIDGVNNNGQSYGVEAFVDALTEVSDGRLQVEVTTPYRNGAHDAESDLVAAIASGDVDGGWPSTRAFAEGGIHGLEAVEAPMLITSYQAQKDLVSGPVAEQILETLEGSGIVGLGLVVGPLRRAFTVEPLLDPEDWAGNRIRVFNSPTQADAMSALDA
jgi:TRAP-type C4-dicarboxylate transport system substrate-binding protein